MIARIALGCLLVASLVGCSGEMDHGDAVAKANATNLQRLTNLYLAYQTDNGWVGPPDDAKFKDYLRAFNPDKLKRIGIDPAAIDAIFTSDRDHQPFKIRYSVKGNVMGSFEPVVFESTGVDGKRLVGFLDMSSREVEDAEYEALFSGKTKAAAPVR